MAIIQLHRGRSLFSRLIKWQTRSPISHASVLFADEEIVIESREGRGVQMLPAEHYAAERANGRVTCYRVRTLTPAQASEVRHFMARQVGLGYDYGAVLKFISRRNAAHDHRWFCSELVFAAFAHAGVPLLANVEAWAVSPGDLLKSPLLEETGGAR